MKLFGDLKPDIFVGVEFSATLFTNQHVIMYIGNDDSHTRYDRDGTQRHTQGNFLILATPEDVMKVEHGLLRGLVRKVAMEQVGHFMMGKARIGGHTYTVSGSYGSDGLPMDLHREHWERFGTEVPEDLYEAWKTGGGHNSAGSEAEQMRKWAESELL